MLTVEHFFRLRNQNRFFRVLSERNVKARVEIVAKDGAFRSAVRGLCQACEFFFQFLAHGVRECHGIQSLLVIYDFIIVFFAEFGLNCLHFLAEVVLFMAFLHTCMHIGFDFCLACRPGKFFFQQVCQPLEARVRIKDVKHLLAMTVIIEQSGGDAVRGLANVFAADNRKVRIAEHVVAALFIFVRYHACKPV